MRQVECHGFYTSKPVRHCKFYYEDSRGGTQFKYGYTIMRHMYHHSGQGICNICDFRDCRESPPNPKKNKPRHIKTNRNELHSEINDGLEIAARNNGVCSQDYLSVNEYVV